MFSTISPVIIGVNLLLSTVDKLTNVTQVSSCNNDLSKWTSSGQTKINYLAYVQTLLLFRISFCIYACILRLIIEN